MSSLKGRKQSKEHVNKKTLAILGAMKNPAVIAKISKAKIGNKNGIGNKGMTGKKHTEAWKKENSERMRNRIVSQDTKEMLKIRMKERRDKLEKRQLRSTGYIWIYVEGETRRVPEHHYVIEKHAGRKIVKGEVVHHINGDKTDNNINNLLLCKSQSEHRKTHYQLELCALNLLKEGLIVFKDGIYQIPEAA